MEDAELRRYLNAVLALLALLTATVFFVVPRANSQFGLSLDLLVVLVVVVIAIPIYLVPRVYVLAAQPDAFRSESTTRETE